MDFAHIKDFTHKHCRFKLRSGKEVFGVVWEVETTDITGQLANTKRLYFASVRDDERLQHDRRQPIGVIPMQPEEIVHAESLAS